MDHFLTKIKNKPDAYKRRCAFLVAALITAIVFAFWLVSFRVTVAERDIERGAERAAEGKKSAGVLGSGAEASTILSAPPLESVLETVKQGLHGVAEITEIIQGNKE